MVKEVGRMVSRDRQSLSGAPGDVNLGFGARNGTCSLQGSRRPFAATDASNEPTLEMPCSLLGSEVAQRDEASFDAVARRVR